MRGPCVGRIARRGIMRRELAVGSHPVRRRRVVLRPRPRRLSAGSRGPARRRARPRRVGTAARRGLRTGLADPAVGSAGLRGDRGRRRPGHDRRSRGTCRTGRGAERALAGAAGRGPPGGLGLFRLVTFAQSFHWMDRAGVAAAAHAILEAGGTCVHVHATTHEGVDTSGPLPHPQPPRAAIAELVRRYLGPRRRAGQGVLPAAAPPAARTPSTGPPASAAPAASSCRAPWSNARADHVVAAVFSLSGSAPHLFGPRRAPSRPTFALSCTTPAPPASSASACGRSRSISGTLDQPRARQQLASSIDGHRRSWQPEIMSDADRARWRQRRRSR